MRQINSQLSKSVPGLRLVIIFLGFFFCAVGVRAQDKFGYVLDVRGDWVLNSSAKLSKGSSVPVGGVITTPSPGDGSAYIVVANRNGDIFDRRNCGNAGECSKPIKLPASAGADQSLTSRIISAAMALVSNEPAKYASFVSRGTDLQEAVVKLEGDRLDLSSVFKNMQGDHYLLRFEQMNKVNVSRGRTPKPLDFSWDPKKPQPLVVKDLPPGLYKVNLLEVSLLEADAGEHELTGNEAWVFVATGAGYGKASSFFDAVATKVTKQWGTDVKQSVARTYLRATLAAINDQTIQ